MEIQIPSPSVFLRSPVQPAQPAPPTKKTTKPKTASKAKAIDKDASGAVTKPKQSKSRNGCMTCKKKRLKCDETKPSCVQCQKRNVACEGYKKDFKWRTFEETTFNNKVSSKRRLSNSAEGSAKKPKLPHHGSWPLESAFESASRAFQDPTAPASLSPSASLELPPPVELEPAWSPSKFEPPSPGSTFDLNTTPVPQDTNAYPSPFSGSPSLMDLLLPGTDMNQPPDLSEERPPMSPMPYQPGPSSGIFRSDEEADGDSDGEADGEQDREADEEADEEVIREITQWRRGSPTPSEESISSPSSGLSILASPRLDLTSAEMLLMRFDNNTCGILSVKDGPSENPWRNLVWPLAQDCPALYHAVASMTAFHGKGEDKRLRIAGVAHMHKSIKRLAVDMKYMSLHSSLATSLALCLGEGWDESATTGIQHLHGASIMVKSALAQHQHQSQLGPVDSLDALRLKFLCNTFVYLDVIARLTSPQEPRGLKLEDILTATNPIEGLKEVDPLMGCATTLFPLIGRVASLIQKVRKTETNSLNIVSRANELQQQLLQWQTPESGHFIRPEDPTSEVEHSIRTAEAYRIATLLYLHQAVPEIPSDQHEAMAKRVLVLLASVPLSSRTIIVQIYPLFAASCEVVTQEDRNWVTDRWSAMMTRLTIANIDSCWSVVREVWRRRDEFQVDKLHRQQRAPNLPRRSTMTDIPLDQIEPEYTVRGRLHWLGVMSEWQWEVFLG